MKTGWLCECGRQVTLPSRKWRWKDSAWEHHHGPDGWVRAVFVEEPKDLVMRFGCAVRLPKDGTFAFMPHYLKNPADFIQRWIRGAVGTIYTGHGQKDGKGQLLKQPEVLVRHVPDKR